MWLGTDGGSGSGQLLEEANVITGAGACIVHLRGTDGAGNTTRARIDFGPRSQVGDNRLEVMLNGVATLAQLAGASHTVVVEEVNMQSSVSEKPAVLIVEDRSEIDDLDEIQHAQAYIEKTADDTEVGSWFVNLTCTARIQGKSTIGDFTIEGEVEFIGIPPNPPDPAIVKHSTVNNFEIDATSVAASNGKVNVSAYADVTALTPSRIGALEIRSLGKFALQEGTADLLTVGSLFILKGPTAAEGVLDLTDNAMIIDYTFDSPFAGIRDYIVQGYNFNDPPTPLWIGDGINSSTAAVVATNQNDPYKTGIGYAEASALFTSFPATWEGQTNVDNTSVLLKYTFYGDANLDGGVNLPDFNRLAANFGGTEKVWSEGDFHYDGNVNLQDFNRLAANFGQGTTVSTYDDYTTEELEEMLPD